MNSSSEGPLASRYRQIFRLVGVHNGRPITIHSVAFLTINAANMFYLFYTAATTNRNVDKVAHFMFLQYFYAGTLWTTISRSQEMIWAASECDKSVGLNGPEANKKHETITEEIRLSFPRRLVDLTTGIGSYMAGYICIEPFLKSWLGNKPLELPFTGSHDDTKLFVAIYLLQCSLMFVTGCAMIVVIQTMMEFPFNLKAKYQLLNWQLSVLNESMIDDANVYSTKLYKIVQKSVETHQQILSIFQVYREVCTYGFRFSYIGLLGATSLSRSLLSGDQPDIGIIPHIVSELSYIGFFSYFLDQLETENDKLRDAVFAGEWYRMPKQVTSSLRLLMERTKRRPQVILYQGGGPANLESFFKLLNGTCGYIMFGLILDRAM